MSAIIEYLNRHQGRNAPYNETTSQIKDTIKQERNPQTFLLGEFSLNQIFTATEELREFNQTQATQIVDFMNVLMNMKARVVDNDDPFI